MESLADLSRFTCSSEGEAGFSLTLQHNKSGFKIEAISCFLKWLLQSWDFEGLGFYNFFKFLNRCQ